MRWMRPTPQVLFTATSSRATFSSPGPQAGAPTTPRSSTSAWLNWLRRTALRSLLQGRVPPWARPATYMSPEQKLIYGGLGESDLSAESTSKAYQLRDRTSDGEKFFITASYHRRVTGNLEKAKQTCELWAQNYPREMVSHDYLAAIYPTFGRYDQGVEEAKKAIGLAPDFAIGYALLAMNYQFLDLLEEATNTLQQASGRKLEIPDFLVQRYDIAFLKSDKAEMQQEAALGQGKSGAVKTGFQTTRLLSRRILAACKRPGGVT